MKLAFAFLLIVFLAFSGYHLTFRRFRMPFYARPFSITGSEFLFLGLLLGPWFLNILDREAQKELFFLHAFLLGWIGLIFGFQFELAKLRRFPRGYVFAAITEGTLSFVLIFGVIQLTACLFPGAGNVVHMGDAMVLGAVGACTAQTGIALVASGHGPKFGKLVLLLRCISSIGPLVPLVSFGLFFSFGKVSAANLWWLSEVGNGFIILLGSCLGLVLLLAFFLKEPRQESELILLLLSTVTLGSGLSSVLGMSPLFFTFLLGLFLVNMSREKERLYQILITVEKPAYVLLLVLLGANWRLYSIWVPVLAVAYCVYRGIVKVGAGAIATRIAGTAGERLPGLSGLGLLHQGGLSLAMLLDFQRGFSSSGTSWVVSLVLIGVLLNDIMGLFLTERLLRNATP